MDKEWLKYYKYTKEQTAVLYETANWLISRCLYRFSKQAQKTHTETILRLVEDLVYTGGTEYAHAKVVGNKISYLGSKLTPTSMSELNDQIHTIREVLAATVGVGEWKKTRTLVHEFVGYVIAWNPWKFRSEDFLLSRYGKFVVDKLDVPDGEWYAIGDYSKVYEHMLDTLEVHPAFDWHHTKPEVEKHPILQFKDNVVDAAESLDVTPAEQLAETTQDATPEPKCALSLYPTVGISSRLVYKSVLRKRALYNKDCPIRYQYKPTISILPSTTLDNGYGTKPPLLQHSGFIGSPFIGSRAFRPIASLCRRLQHTDTLARKPDITRYPNSPP